jgi:hypothetical protein
VIVSVAQFHAQVRVLGVGNEKTNYSVMLCASATGQKLPAAVVLARTRPLTKVENDNRRHLKLYYTGAHGTTWFSEAITLQWLQHNFNVGFFVFYVCLIHYFVLETAVRPSSVINMGPLQTASHSGRARAWPHQQHCDGIRAVPMHRTHSASGCLMESKF